MTDSEFDYATASEMATAMEAGTTSSTELTEIVIARIEKYDAPINAIPVRDFDNAMKAAHEADRARALGERGPLLGVPMTVKESFNVAGLVTSWGLPQFQEFVAETDALPVSRLREAGAVILGKTNVPVGLGDVQTYNPLHGTTSNPWDVTRTPGGSSGGSAAALAAGFGAVSIGSDLAGSLRIPAHFSGVFAHKPSFGVLPSRGHTPPSALPLAYERDLSVVGPMSRSASDLKVLLEMLAHPDKSALGTAHRLVLRAPRHERLADHRVLVLDEHPDIATSVAVRRTVDHVASVLEAAGASVHRTSSLLPGLGEASRIYMRLLLAAVAATYPPDVYASAQQAALVVDPADRSLAAERARGAVLSHRDWVAADAARVRLRAEWVDLFEQFDVVITPPSPTAAFAHDQSPDQWSRRILVDGAGFDYADQLVWAGMATAPGLPATVIPAGRTEEDLPIGVQLIGPMFEDRTTIRLAELLEREIGGFNPPSLG